MCIDTANVCTSATIQRRYDTALAKLDGWEAYRYIANWAFSPVPTGLWYDGYCHVTPWGSALWVCAVQYDARAVARSDSRSMQACQHSYNCADHPSLSCRCHLESVLLVHVLPLCCVLILVCYNSHLRLSSMETSYRAREDLL